jgi:hypothetical protein
VSLSPIFEAAFWRRGAEDDAFWDLLENLEASLCFDPYSVGERHPAFPNGKCWVWESPDIERLPKVVVLYTIDDENGRIVLRNFYTKP